MSDNDSTGYLRRVDFYEQPDDGSINTVFVRYLRGVLHGEDPYPYHAAEKFSSAAMELIDLVWSPSWWNILIWPFTRPHITRVLCTVDTILDCEQRLGDTCYELIRDVSREIDSGNVVFGASLRDRCKAVNLRIGFETWKMENVMYKQRKDFNPARLCYVYTRFHLGSAVLCLIIGLLTLVASLFFTVSLKFQIRGFSLAFLMGFLAKKGCQTQVYMTNIARHVNMVHAEVFTSVWAWRDMRGFLNLVIESEGSPLSDVSHAKRFLESFQTSFMGGDVELWKTRSKVRALSKFGDKVQAMKDRDAGEDSGSSVACHGYRNSALDFFRLVLTRLYTKVSGSVSSGEED